MDEIKVSKTRSFLLGAVGIICGMALSEASFALADRFPAYKTAIFVVLLLLMAVFFTYSVCHTLGSKGKKAGMSLGGCLIIAGYILLFLFDKDYFQQETVKTLIPVAGIVLMGSGFSIFLASCYYRPHKE